MVRAVSKYQSLGKFRPSVLRSTVIARELAIWLKERGVGQPVDLHEGKHRIGVREPEEHMRIASGDDVVPHWHRDGLGADATNPKAVPGVQWLILWSNGTATEILDDTEGQIHFEPCDVLLIDNREVWHRCPPAEEGRWFARLIEPDLSMLENTNSAH